MATDHWQTPLPDPHSGPSRQALGAEQLLARRCVAGAQLPGGSRFRQASLSAIAADLADKTAANALKHGINEHYESVTGKPLGVGNLGMSCAIVTLMLDQLTSNYHLKVKGSS